MTEPAEKDPRRKSVFIGYKTNTDPDWQKHCLDAWILYGNTIIAGEKLGIKQQTLGHNAWRYLLDHLDEARIILDADALHDTRYGRGLTDKEFKMRMTKKALGNMPPKSFNKWIIENKIYEYPDLVNLYKVRYPIYYEQHMALYEQSRNTTEISG